MKNEASDTTMLAVTVIALAVVVVIGFGIFQYARSSLNSGSDKLSNALDTVNASDYADYDQKTVSGTKVLSAMQNFEGSNCAILVGTTALNKTGSVVNSKSGNTAGDGTGFAILTVPRGDVELSVINYNALLDDEAAADVDNFTLNNGTYTFNSGFEADGGIVKFYNTKEDYNTTGMTEYIATGTKFHANLIKDNSGTIVGIVFIQLGAEEAAGT